MPLATWLAHFDKLFPFQKPVNEKYPREQEIIDNIVMSRNKISHSAIVSKSDGELRAAAPEDFIPNPSSELANQSTLSVYGKVSSPSY